MKKYNNIIGYGVGQYYESVKEELSQIVTLTYLCDRKWEEEQPEEYDGIPTISKNKLAELENTLIIITIGSRWIYETIIKELQSLGLNVIHVDEVIGRTKEIDGKTLKSNYLGSGYTDVRGNKIWFDETLPDNIIVSFVGCNNELSIDENLVIGNLYIQFGNNGTCRIGKNTEIVGARLFVSNSQILIGNDCLFSTEVIIRTHDSHHIFDLTTRKRINFSRDVIIEDNVWIAHRVSLLAGARIGTGSIVGSSAVTSSQFGKHQLIVGSPAKCIRKNICWSRDNTDYFDRTCLEECKSKDALKYL